MSNEDDNKTERLFIWCVFLFALSGIICLTVIEIVKALK